MAAVELVGDGIEQMGLAQAGLAVDKEGVVAVARIFGHGQGGGVGEFVGGAHHEALEGVVLGAGHEGRVGGGPGIGGELLQLPLSQDDHFEIRGEKFVQGLFNGGKVTGKDDVPFEIGWGVEDKAVGIHGDRLCVVKPGIDGGWGHVRLHEGEHLGPDIGW